MMAGLRRDLSRDLRLRDLRRDLRRDGARSIHCGNRYGPRTPRPRLRRVFAGLVDVEAMPCAWMLCIVVGVLCLALGVLCKYLPPMK